MPWPVWQTYDAQDKGEMIAFLMVDNKRRDYLDEQRRLKLERDDERKRKGGRGNGAYDAMKRKFYGG